MLGFIGQTVQGGWSALANITSGIGKGASTLVSGFFPTPQRDKVKSESVLAAEGSGLTYRPTLPENIGMMQTWSWSQRDWETPNPYQAQFAVPAKIKESQGLAAKVSTEIPQGPIETFVDVATWGTTQANKITTVADEFMIAWGLKKREPISEGPKETGASRGTIQYLNDIRDKTASVLPAVKSVGSAIVDQVKGLFSMAFEPTGSQPVFSIQHELEPKTKIAGIVVAGIIIAILIFGRKK